MHALGLFWCWALLLSSLQGWLVLVVSDEALVRDEASVRDDRTVRRRRLEAKAVRNVIIHGKGDMDSRALCHGLMTRIKDLSVDPLEVQTDTSQNTRHCPNTR
jgi:hypothetical protein